MYKLLFIGIFLTLAISASDIVATVNDKSITKNDVDKFISKSIPGAKYSFMNTQQKRKVIDQLIERELYIEVAKSEGIQKDPQFEKELKKVKENLILDLWMKNRLESIHIAKRDMEAYYRENDAKFYQAARATARHILVTTRAEAEEIIRALESSPNLKERFIEFARLRSTGPSSKNGGNLGWFSKDQMVPEFSNAAFSLNTGHITHLPVKTHFGYHIIYLEDKQPAGKVEFTKVRDSIANSLKLKKFQKNLENLSRNLKKSAKILIK